jgi:Skp family chaperone for outer membrane proteins
MSPALQARIAQLKAERDYRASVAEFRARRAADQQERISALLQEVIAALAELPLGEVEWANQFSRKTIVRYEAALKATAA